MPAEIDTGRPRVLHCDHRAVSNPLPESPRTARILNERPDDRFFRATFGTHGDRAKSSRSVLEERRQRRRSSRRSREGRRCDCDRSRQIQPEEVPPRDGDQFAEIRLEERTATAVVLRRSSLPVEGSEDEEPSLPPDSPNCFDEISVRARRTLQIGKVVLEEDPEEDPEEDRWNNTREERLRRWTTVAARTDHREDAEEDAEEGDKRGGYGKSLFSSHSGAYRDSSPRRPRRSGTPRDAEEGSTTRSRADERPDETGRTFRPARRSGTVLVDAPRSGSTPKRPASSLRLALLLFLIALGHGGLFGSSARQPGVRLGAGFSAFTMGTVIGAVSAAPIDPIGDAAIRAERSANLSHITGSTRKIQMYIKNRHLQILPDGTVNGSNDDSSDYTIFQRIAVSRGQLRIQGVATCLYLCMDSCGLLYGAHEYSEDCVFNETLEQHNYNTYSSAHWSTSRKTLYVGLNRHGQPRRVQTRGRNLGRLSTYARVLTLVAPTERVEALQRRILGAEHNIRHHHGLQQAVCPNLPAQERDGRDRFRCRRRKKRKKKKRRCREDEAPGPQCEPAKPRAAPTANPSSPQSKRSCEGAASEQACRRQALNAPSKKRKSRIEEKQPQTSGGRQASPSQRKPNGKKPPNAKKANVGKTPNGVEGKKKGVGGGGGSGGGGGGGGGVPKKKDGKGKKPTGRVTRTTVSEVVVAPTTSAWPWYPGASTTPAPASSPRSEGVDIRGENAETVRRRLQKSLSWRVADEEKEEAEEEEEEEDVVESEEFAPSTTTKTTESYDEAASSSAPFPAVGDDDLLAPSTAHAAGRHDDDDEDAYTSTTVDALSDSEEVEAGEDERFPAEGLAM